MTSTIQRQISITVVCGKVGVGPVSGPGVKSGVVDHGSSEESVTVIKLIIRKLNTGQSVDLIQTPSARHPQPPKLVVSPGDRV
jgi:hypothetical protein